MRNSQSRTWDMARNTEKGGKCETQTVGGERSEKQPKPWKM